MSEKRMIVLDTNVISELRKVGDGKADARVTAWVSDRDAASLYISALTLMELEIGILRIERRDPEQGGKVADLDGPTCIARIPGAHAAGRFRCRPEVCTIACARSTSRTGRVDRCNRHSAWDDGRHGKPVRLRSNRCRANQSLERIMTDVGWRIPHRIAAGAAPGSRIRCDPSGRRSRA